MMRNRIFALAVVLVAGVSVWIVAAERAAKDQSAFRVLIVIEGVHSREGVGKLEAISVVGREKIAKLESFFPNYAKHPSSDIAGGWKAGAQVYFDCGHGRTVRVTVSANDDGRTWSVGQGDFKTDGDFDGYVKELQKLVAPARKP
jgi:hypothetical protein